VGDVPSEKIVECIKELAEFEVKVISANTFENAQVCSGGVPMCEVDENFRSVKDKNVYIVGELLDCDGVCGGYNLQWAWTSGAIAGASAGKES
jgi:predicted flavoprotein YhiN